MTLPGSSRTAQLGCSGRDSPPQTALHGHWKSNPEQLCCEAEGARCHCLHRMQVFLSWEQLRLLWELPLPTSKSPGQDVWVCSVRHAAVGCLALGIAVCSGGFLLALVSARPTAELHSYRDQQGLMHTPSFRLFCWPFFLPLDLDKETLIANANFKP